MNHRVHPAPPAARTEGLLIEHIDGETVVYDVERKEAHALTPIAASVFAEADGNASLAELAERVTARVGDVVTESQVWDALVQLEASELLDAPKGGMSRRDMVRRTAFVAAATVPLVTSIAMPSVANAASCNVNAPCGSPNYPPCGNLRLNESTCGCFTGTTRPVVGPTGGAPYVLTQNTCQFIPEDD